MKRYAVPFVKVDQDEEFKRLAYETGGELQEGNSTIHCTGPLASGVIKRWHADAGLHIRLWDLVFNEPVDLLKEAFPLYIPNAGYNLTCILTPDTVALKSVNQHQQVTKMRDKTMVLSPDTVNTVLQIAEGGAVRMIDFQIAPYWLRNLPGYIQIVKYFDESIIETNGLPVLMEACNRKTSQLAAKLFNTAIAGGNLPELFTTGEQLISGFLDSLYKPDVEKSCGNVAVYYDKIMEAEEILKAHLHTTLPRLENVAQQVALSESTLKRYFKLVFGKSIYEYYLNKKMEKAHKMLLEKPLTVNEAAELMGYEKVSNFIDIFKKHHGYSPGTIRKKNGAIQDTNNPGTFIA